MTPSTKFSLPSLLFCLAILAMVLGIYLPGMGNDLVFDDARIPDTVMVQFGSLFDIKQRMLSYGSFVWIEGLAGSGWWKQRLVNLALHVGVAVALVAFFRDLLRVTPWTSPDEAAEPRDAATVNAAVLVGVALFAVNPVATYAVAYLIQRSILMATLFTVLGLWMVLRGLTSGRLGWYAAALVSYIAAVLSKEYAVMAAGLVLPLYIHVKRPGWKTIAIIGAVTLTVVAAVMVALLTVYGHLVGQMFDQRSRDFAQQLDQLHPGVAQLIYPLSILNEAALFFVYGFFWFIPNVTSMSLDMRPGFPVSLMAFPHVLGAVAYVAVLVIASWLVLRRRGAWALVGLCLLMPALLYLTEFATVWVQDPFVLYRSYLWAIAIPGLLALVFMQLKARTSYLVGLVLALGLSALAFERVQSLQDDFSAWSDAATKVDRQAGANAVGRWRPFLNLGAHYLDKGDLAQAQQNFAQANALGDLHGAARFNQGLVLQQQQKHAEAQAAFADAQAKGFTDFGLFYHRAESEFALGQFDKAWEDFSTALTKSDTEAKMTAQEKQQLQADLRLRRAETAIAVKRYDQAIEDFELLRKQRPDNARQLIGLGMAYTGKGNTAQAIQLLDGLIARTPSGAAFYGRGMAHYTAGNLAAALKDLDQAIALEPKNTRYTQVRATLAAGRK